MLLDWKIIKYDCIANVNRYIHNRKCCISEVTMMIDLFFVVLEKAAIGPSLDFLASLGPIS